MSIKDISLSRVIIRLFFFSAEPRIENFHNFLRKAQSFFFFPRIHGQNGPKNKTCGFVVERYCSRGSNGRLFHAGTPISGKKNIWTGFSPLRNLKSYLNSKSFLNRTANTRLTPMFLIFRCGSCTGRQDTVLMTFTSSLHQLESIAACWMRASLSLAFDPNT